jgi:hypothetical protein
VDEYAALASLLFLTSAIASTFQSVIPSAHS